ncbi:MAG: 23S rRNA pseudouridine(955/2504/2580) synthase RluC [Pseudomonadales bacterium]
MSDNSPMHSVRYVEISDDRAGQRLDNFLFVELKNIPRSRIYRMVRGGEVRINKKRAKQTYRLAAGDMVRIPPVRVQDSSSSPPKLSLSLQKMLKRSILHECENLLVIDKPSGLAVHGGSGIHTGLIEALRLLRPDDRRLELVHRLDRDTSGCILIARNRRTLLDLHQQLQAKSLRKTYHALVIGGWPAALSRIDAPLLKNELNSGERVVRVSKEGQRASTLFKVKERFDSLTLVEASPVTGRTHQIRVHALHAGHAIAGDEKYASQEVNRQLSGQGLKRLFLHASRLQFRIGEQVMDIRCPLSSDLELFLEKLRK